MAVNYGTDKTIWIMALKDKMKNKDKGKKTHLGSLCAKVPPAKTPSIQILLYDF